MNQITQRYYIGSEKLLEFAVDMFDNVKLESSKDKSVKFLVTARQCDLVAFEGLMIERAKAIRNSV